MNPALTVQQSFFFFFGFLPGALYFSILGYIAKSWTGDICSCTTCRNTRSLLLKGPQEDTSCCGPENFYCLFCDRFDPQPTLRSALAFYLGCYLWNSSQWIVPSLINIFIFSSCISLERRCLLFFGQTLGDQKASLTKWRRTDKMACTRYAC